MKNLTVVLVKPERGRVEALALSLADAFGDRRGLVLCSGEDGVAEAARTIAMARDCWSVRFQRNLGSCATSDDFAEALRPHLDGHIPVVMVVHDSALAAGLAAGLAARFWDGGGQAAVVAMQLDGRGRCDYYASVSPPAAAV